MRVIGLTGGIASGKSTVSRLLQQHYALPVIDADQVAREVVEPGTPALQEIAAAFGDEYIRPDGRLDRPKLGALIFSDPQKRSKLNQITHPRVAEHTATLVQHYQSQGVSLLIYEVPLLFENGLQDELHPVLLVALPPKLQLQRLCEREAITKAEAQARIESQMPLSEKRALADFVIDNHGTPQELLAHVHHTWAQVLAYLEANPA